MTNVQGGAPARLKLPLGQVLGLLGPYVRRRLGEQVKAVWLIVLYLVAFQTLVLDIPIFGASIVALGIVLVVVGLSFFMEGLLLGLMPLGEMIGVRLPQKSRLPTILLFAFVLGVGATFAEPAVGVLKAAGASVKAWDAPLLYLLLNQRADDLVVAVGVGVGIAVVLGMLRFLYGWSLKPFIYVLVPLLLALSLWAAFDPNLIHVTGLAWDCGGVTTGPVTVPLVLALGIGICRVVARDGEGGGGGFGVVTLASAVPIVAVLLLGIALQGSVPKPAAEADFLGAAQRERAAALFESPAQMTGYVLSHASAEGQLAYFGGHEAMLDAVRRLAASEAEQVAAFGVDGAARFRAWAVTQADEAQKLAVFGSAEALRRAADAYAAAPERASNLVEVTARNVVAALQAIVPLSVLFFLVLWLVLRERARRVDELLLGIGLAVVGMTIFGMGIELGLSRLGGQVGDKLPAAFKAVELGDQRQVIRQFDPALVHTAIAEDGTQARFFYLQQGGGVVALPFDEAKLDPASGSYTFTPSKGPLFGEAGALAGIVVVLAFAFVMGYGATLAEPALNALGRTVEEITVGTFRKSLLMQAVAVGVGLGMLFGVAKIVWGVPLIALLAPPYLLLLVLTRLASEEFVNIGWDSAGVTTGPITVPLVLAMGLGVGGQVGVVEGFGILAMASVYPIVTVLAVSLWASRRREAALRDTALPR
ncbi:MAG: DUF1538 domain-containing protein [Burkholderiaceae bacterium]|nr:DUF1538 domain-containing protein [Burkholderiaceae bacterium]